MPRIGVALSGGGHRAALFGLGALLYIVDAGKHREVVTISSVSGGSLTNAFVGLNVDFSSVTASGFEEAVRPLACDRLDDLLGAIGASGAELRVMPSLIDLWRSVIQSSMQFSGTRLRNARGWDSVDWASVPLGTYAAAARP